MAASSVSESTQRRQIVRLFGQLKTNHNLMSNGTAPKSSRATTGGRSRAYGDLVDKQVDFWNEVRSKRDEGVQAARTRMLSANWGQALEPHSDPDNPFLDQYDAYLDSVLGHKQTWLPTFKKLNNPSLNTSAKKKNKKGPAEDAVKTMLFEALGNAHVSFNELGKDKFDEFIEEYNITNSCSVTLIFTPASKEDESGTKRKPERDNTAGPATKKNKKAPKQVFETDEESEEEDKPETKKGKKGKQNIARQDDFQPTKDKKGKGKVTEAPVRDNGEEEADKDDYDEDEAAVKQESDLDETGRQTPPPRRPATVGGFDKTPPKVVRDMTPPEETKNALTSPVRDAIATKPVALAPLSSHSLLPTATNSDAPATVADEGETNDSLFVPQEVTNQDTVETAADTTTTGQFEADFNGEVNVDMF